MTPDRKQSQTMQTNGMYIFKYVLLVCQIIIIIIIIQNGGKYLGMEVIAVSSDPAREHVLSTKGNCDFLFMS